MNVQFILFIFTYSVENTFLMYKLKNTKELLDNIASDSGEYFFHLAAASNSYELWYPPIFFF